MSSRCIIEDYTIDDYVGKQVEWNNRRGDVIDILCVNDNKYFLVEPYDRYGDCVIVIPDEVNCVYEWR